MSFSKFAAVAVVGTVLAAAGCGGSSSKSGSSTTATSSTTAGGGKGTAPVSTGEIRVQKGASLTRAAWIKKGDAICLQTNSRLSTTTAKTAQDFARLLPQAAAYEHTEASELSKLVPPASEQSNWQHMITDLQKFSELSARVAEYAAANNFPAATPIAAAGNKAQEDMVAIAKAAGFKSCSVV